MLVKSERKYLNITYCKIIICNEESIKKKII